MMIMLVNRPDEYRVIIATDSSDFAFELGGTRLGRIDLQLDR